MKRDIIIIEDKAVSVTGNEIWMTATEIAGLFHTGVPAVNAAIRAVRKPDVLNDYEVCRYMRLENGLSRRRVFAGNHHPHRLPAEHLPCTRVPHVAGRARHSRRKSGRHT